MMMKMKVCLKSKLFTFLSLVLGPLTIYHGRGSSSDYLTTVEHNQVKDNESVSVNCIGYGALAHHLDCVAPNKNIDINSVKWEKRRGRRIYLQYVATIMIDGEAVRVKRMTLHSPIYFEGMYTCSMNTSRISVNVVGGNQ